ncbi:MAG: class I SAM-dependent methyltransferase [Actinomycetota bacterium]
MPIDEYRAANLANWNERVIGHTAPDGYDIAGLIADPDRITDVVRFDQDVFGDVTGKNLLHSQCHIATDTLSWARLGATVTGLDFSPDALASARDTAAKMGIDATFVETELYDAPNHIDHEFDCVYTSVGAINWLPDIAEWGRVMAGFVKPGGQFYIRDGHPALYSLDDERDDRDLVITHPYFHDGQPLRWEDATSYAGSATIENDVMYEWIHPISSIVMALINAGLVVDELRELDHLDWPFFSFMESVDGERYVLPEAQRRLVPLQFSILAHKPA